MMITDTIIQEFKRKVCEEIRLIEEGTNRFRVFTPFRFDDGDHLSIVLKKEQNQWVISDEGHTFMHLSYCIDSADLMAGTRKQLIDYALNEFQVQDRYGELIVIIHNTPPLPCFSSSSSSSSLLLFFHSYYSLLI